jgi:CheY-like chemotaxis protein
MAKVVVAEDDAHIRRVIALWLGRQQHQVLEAGNGQQALALIEAHHPDILVTDLNMPQMDGLALLAALEQQQLRPAGVVVLTNRWDHQEIGARLAGQGVQVIPKPFSPTKLAALIDSLSRQPQQRPG